MTNVYFLQCGKLLKIGKADDVAERLSQLQTGNPAELKLVAVLTKVLPSVERMYHQAFAPWRERGEWFRRSPELDKILNFIQGGARPTTPDDIQFYLSMNVKSVRNASKWRPTNNVAFGRLCSEARKLRRLALADNNWVAVREAFIAGDTERERAARVAEGERSLQ